MNSRTHCSPLVLGGTETGGPYSARKRHSFTICFYHRYHENCHGFKLGTFHLHQDRIKTKGDISRVIIYVHCKATEHPEFFTGQKYRTQSSHLLFLNSVSPLCPHRCVNPVAQKLWSLGFLLLFISPLLLPLTNTRKRAQPQHCGKAKVSS